MRYYKVTLQNGEELFHESKNSLTNERLLAEMQEVATLSPVEVEDVQDIDEITEDDYEMASQYN
jgi:hypothetical protein